MLAVMLVVADHLTGWPAGGFIGVDVFFVISGFLITSRLLRMVGSVGVARYFGTFYKLRAVRILPAAVVTLVLTCVASELVYNGERASSVLSDSLWALVFAANWHFAANGTDYLHASGPISPVQHYWSLSVEEQFYLGWPILLLLIVPICALIGRRSERSKRTLAAIAAVVVCSLSLAWAFHESSASPTVAYFSSFTRAWELAAGALLACAAPALKRFVSAGLGTVGSWLGLVLILLSAVVIDTATQFPAPGAMLPVVGSMLVIAAGIGNVPANWVLTNRVATWVGDLSYSIYLTHFPAVILIGALLPHDKYLDWAAVLLVTLGLSIASYYFIEEPVRSRFGKPRPVKKPQEKAVIALTLAVSAMFLYVFQSPPQLLNVPIATAGTTQTAAFPKDLAAPQPALQRQLVAALTATHLPNATNASKATLAKAMKNWEPCETVVDPVAACTFAPKGGPDPKKVAMVIGDSIALSYLPAMRQALVPHGWTVVGFGLEQCPAAFVQMLRVGTNGLWADCDRHHAAYQSAIKKVDPSLIVLTSIADTIDHMWRDKTPAAYQAGMEKTLGIVSGPGRKVLVLSPPPSGDSLADCATAAATAADCTAKLRSVQAVQAQIDQSTAAKAGALYLNTEQLFCYQGLCPAVVGNVAVRYDASHITPEYGALVAPSLYQSLVTVGAVSG